MEIQIALGADIIMAFDECTEHPADRSRARQSMDLTLRWAGRSQRILTSISTKSPWAPSRSHRSPLSSAHGTIEGHFQLNDNH